MKRAPDLADVEEAINLARSVGPGRARWSARRGFNPWLVQMGNRRIRRDLVRQRGQFDMIMQRQTVCSPEAHVAGVPSAVYTDSTMALTQRFYPRWAPLSHRAALSGPRFEAKICHSARHVFTCSEFVRRFVGVEFTREGGSVLLRAWPALRRAIPNAELVARAFRCAQPGR